MRNRLGNPEPLTPDGPTLGERAEFGISHGEPGRGERSRKDQLTKALVVPCPVEERHGLLEAGDGLTIVTLGLVDGAEGLIR